MSSRAWANHHRLICVSTMPFARNYRGRTHVESREAVGGDDQQGVAKIEYLRPFRRRALESKGVRRFA